MHVHFAIYSNDVEVFTTNHETAQTNYIYRYLERRLAKKKIKTIIFGYLNSLFTMYIN